MTKQTQDRANGSTGTFFSCFGFGYCFGIRISTLVIPLALIAFFTPHCAHAIGGRDTPPPPAAPSETKFAQPSDTKLDNGLRIIVVERPALPLIAAQVVVTRGAEADPMDLAGTASMTAALLTKGTESMSAPQIAQAIESLGGDISSGAGWDASSASLIIKSDKIDPAFAILADVVLHPTFKDEELDRARKQRLDGLRVAMEQPGAVAGYVTARATFGAGEYGHASGGTIESVQKLHRDDLVNFYKANYRPDKATLIMVGAVNLEQAKALAEKFLGAWKPEKNSTQSASDTAAEWKPRNVVVDMPQAGQAAVAVAKPAIKRDTPDYYSGLVANAALGSGFASRLNSEIRIKRGLSYGASSSLDARRDTGPFSASAQTKNESAAEVAKLLMSELKRLVDEPVKGEELKSRQAMLTGNYARSLETNEGWAEKLAGLVTLQLPLEKLNQFIPKVNAVTSEDVTAFAKKYFSTPSLIVAGQASAFLDALKKDFPDVQVIAQKDLDLNSPTLVKAGAPAAK